MLKSVQVLVNEQQQKEQQRKRKAQLRARIGRDSSHEGPLPDIISMQGNIPAYRHTVMIGNTASNMHQNINPNLQQSNLHQSQNYHQANSYGGIHPLYATQQASCPSNVPLIQMHADTSIDETTAD